MPSCCSAWHQLSGHGFHLQRPTRPGRWKAPSGHCQERWGQHLTEHEIYNMMYNMKAINPCRADLPLIPRPRPTENPLPRPAPDALVSTARPIAAAAAPGPRHLSTAAAAGAPVPCMTVTFRSPLIPSSYAIPRTVTSPTIGRGRPLGSCICHCTRHGPLLLGGYHTSATSSCIRSSPTLPNNCAQIKINLVEMLMGNADLNTFDLRRLVVLPSGQ